MNTPPASAPGIPRVSVLVPSFNSQAFLAATLESALNQAYREIEIIVVDDGSTDDSLAVARGFESRGVRVIGQDNRGQSGALNIAFDASCGDYLQYLDADDILHPEKIGTQVARLQSADPLAIASGAWTRFRSNLAEAVFMPEPVWRDLSGVDWLVESWRGGGTMHVAAWLIPRRVAAAAGPWIESRRWAPNIDADFFTRALLASSACLFCPEARSYYRAVPGSQSNLRARRSMEAGFGVVIDTGEALLQMEDSDRTRAAFADNLQRFIYGAYPESRDLVSIAEKRVAELGGSTLAPTGGPVFLAASKWIGWKLARRLRRLAGSASGRPAGSCAR